MTQIQYLKQEQQNLKTKLAKYEAYAEVYGKNMRDLDTIKKTINDQEIIISYLGGL